MTISPIASEETSLSPPLSSSRTMVETIFSTRSGSTGRLRREICSERTSLSRSNGTRRPLRLMTVSSRSCTRSKVVKRKLQERHTRRRRIAAESSVGRESLTWVSRLPQLGQRIPAPAALLVIDREPRREPFHLVANPCLDRGIFLDALLRQRVEHLDEHFADLAKLREAEPAAGARR